MTYWKFAPGEQAANWDTQRDSRYIGIGWSKLGNMLNATRAEYDRRRKEIALALGNDEKDGNSNVWKFIHEIKIGDTIIANRGATSIIGIGVVTGDPHYIEDDNNNYPTRRTVEWRYINNDGVKLPDDSKKFAPPTLYKIRDPQQRALVDQLLREQTNKSTVENHKAGYTATQSTPMNLTNIILYGQPGTGKTHALTSLALSILAPNQGDDASYITYAQNIINGATPTQPINKVYQAWHSELQKLVHTGRVEFTTFHQNYAYEDFVEGLRAELDEKTGTVHYKIEPGILKRIAYRALYSWLTGDETDFELDNDQIEMVKYYLSGEKAHGNKPDDPIPNYVLIIDEINRGNVARIFGELITLVEDSKRACRELTLGSQPVFATLPYTKARFILPPNLHIIGTMNTADRSLIGLDAALRRRFDFVELPPRPELLCGDVDGIKLKEFLRTLNQKIEQMDMRDHCIGHAYFMAANSFDDIQAVMRRKVIPQLQEYFHDRPTELKKLLTVGERSFVNDKGVIDSDALVDPDMYTGFATQ